MFYPKKGYFKLHRKFSQKLLPLLKDSDFCNYDVNHTSYFKDLYDMEIEIPTKSMTPIQQRTSNNTSKSGSCITFQGR